MALFDGDSDDIIQTNYRQLRKDGFEEKQSWSIAMKKARKGKQTDRMAEKVARQPRKLKVDLK